MTSAAESAGVERGEKSLARPGMDIHVDVETLARQAWFPDRK
jgi:hypothetical protein